MMKNNGISEIVINEMLLSIPGLTQVEADTLGKSVVHEVKKKVNADEKIQNDARINFLDVQVELPVTTAKEHMAEIIAEQIYQSLR